MSPDGRCEKRVWDNGDQISCGDLVYRKTLCFAHTQERVEALLKEIEEARTILLRKQNELFELRGGTVRPEDRV